MPSGAVRRIVVDEHDFPIDALQCPVEPLDQDVDVLALVEGRHHDAQFRTAAAATQLIPRTRLQRGDWQALGRMLVLTLPLWLIIAPIRPAQPDTFAYLLPNAVYLVDYARLPTSALPPSSSFLPASPYNGL